MGFSVVVGVSCHKVRWMQKIQCISIKRCEVDWMEFGEDSGTEGDPKKVIGSPPVSNDLKLLFKRDTVRLKISARRAGVKNGL